MPSPPLRAFQNGIEKLDHEVLFAVGQEFDSFKAAFKLGDRSWLSSQRGLLSRALDELAAPVRGLYDELRALWVRKCLWS